MYQYCKFITNNNNYKVKIPLIDGAILKEKHLIRIKGRLFGFSTLAEF
jgi:hypothetical protein